jgi:signal transduction histidine kinase/CheY-like chemotaxis protein
MWILSRGRVTVRDKDGNSVVREGFDTDITQMVEAEEERAAMALELSHAQRLQSIGQLSGGVAHDFNNLLAVILGSAQLLASESEQTSVHLRNIIEASTRGSKLTQHLLAFSRKQALRPESIDLNQLLSGMRYLIGQAVGDDVNVELGVPENQWLCFADRWQLENAILNLALNASDAMPDSGVLKVKTSNCTFDSHLCAHLDGVRPGEYVLIEVTDSGTGIAHDIVGRAFEPFFTTKESGEGSGLGLSMVFGFVKQSGGHVDLNTRLGEGTTVRLFLPRSTVAVSKTGISTDPVPAAQDARSLIVVVEDDLNVQQVVLSILDRLGYQSIAFGSGCEALAGLSDVDNVDLLLSDVRLPGGMDGLQLGVRMRERFSELKIVYMSGYVDQKTRNTVEVDKNWPLINKPFGIDELAKVVAEAL